jgi:hypothetical protein
MSYKSLHPEFQSYFKKQEEDSVMFSVSPSKSKTSVVSSFNLQQARDGMLHSILGYK